MRMPVLHYLAGTQGPLEKEGCRYVWSRLQAYVFAARVSHSGLGRSVALDRACSLLKELPSPAGREESLWIMMPGV